MQFRFLMRVNTRRQILRFYGINLVIEFIKFISIWSYNRIMFSVPFIYNKTQGAQAYALCYNQPNVFHYHWSQRRQTAVILSTFVPIFKMYTGHAFSAYLNYKNEYLVSILHFFFFFLAMDIVFTVNGLHRFL